MRTVVGVALMLVWVGTVMGAVFTRDPALIGLASAVTALMAAPLGFLFSSAMQEAVKREVQTRGEEQLADLRARAREAAGADPG